MHRLDAATGQTTIAQLLSHSSGVVRDGVDASFWQQRRAFLDEAELRAELARPPVIDPNTRFKYSNVGFGLLGLVIEAATGEHYADWISREIVAPFGLEETLPDAPIPHAVPAAAGHGGLLPLGKRFPLDGGENTRALASATGFVSTAGDLTRFFGRPGDLAGLYRDAVLGEQFFRLILKQVHYQSPLFPLFISLTIRSIKISVA